MSNVRFNADKKFIALKISPKRNKIVVTNIAANEQETFQEFCNSNGKDFQIVYNSQNECNVTFPTDEEARIFLNLISGKPVGDKSINSKDVSLPKEKAIVAYVETENVYMKLQEKNPNL